MSTQTDRVTDICRECQAMGEEIDEGTAREIASYWHGGQFTAFYAFVSSGHQDRSGLLDELSDIIGSSYSQAGEDDRLMLDMLGTYLLNGKDDGDWN